MAVTNSVTPRAPGGQGELHQFRNDFYDCLTRWPDALFELFDGVSSPVAVGGIAHLSLAATARRGHGSGYAALAKGNIDAGQVRDVLTATRPGGWVPTSRSTPRPGPAATRNAAGAGSTTTSRHSAGNRSWPAGATRGWWACRARRLVDRPVRRAHIPGENLNTLRYNRSRRCYHDWAPAGDGAVRVRRRLRRFSCPSGCRVWMPRSWCGSRATASSSGVRRHARPARAGVPRARGPVLLQGSQHMAHPRRDAGPPGRHLRPRRGTGLARLHPHQRTYREPGGAMTIVEATIIRVRVSRLGRRHRRPKTLWLWWHGPTSDDLDLDRVWRIYLRRFDIEHTIKFAKQSLGWSTPKIRTPQQADRWTWLVLAR